MIHSERQESPFANWPERIASLEIGQNDLKVLMLAMNEKIQQAMIRNAEASERIAAHLEQSKRVWNRVDELENTIRELEKVLVEIREQHRHMQEFTAGVKRVAWIAVTCGGVILWWIIQRWVDQHGR